MSLIEGIESLTDKLSYRVMRSVDRSMRAPVLGVVTLV